LSSFGGAEAKHGDGDGIAWVGCEGGRKKSVRKRKRKRKGDLVVCGRGGTRHGIIRCCFVEYCIVLV